MAKKQLVVFVHGWSVTNLDTYGGLPARLVAEGKAAGFEITVKDVFLGKYVSFRDEVKLPDIAYAFQKAFERDLAGLVKKFGRFAAITHSTGGPVMRDWADRFHRGKGAECPMSHLIMLAPANFGSALAQLGKSRLSRLKTWFQGVEPGMGVLEWLEMGSRDAWELNSRWARGESIAQGPAGVFQFVLTGQSIDRKLYDNLNTYTGELGSDGVVRVTGANLNTAFVRLVQKQPGPDATPKERFALEFEAPVARSPRTALLVVPGKSHSGSEMGILRSVKANPASRGADKDRPTVDGIFDALRVQTAAQYSATCDEFDKRTKATQEAEKVEIEDGILMDREFVHDRRSMVVWRVRDESGATLSDYDLVFTTGPDANPNLFPEGFATDRQRNQRDPGTITYYFNYDVIEGAPEVKHDGERLRRASAGLKDFGVQLVARPQTGFVHYLPAEHLPSKALVDALFRPNETTMVEIVLRRNVHEGVFRLVPGTDSSGRFDKDPAGPIA